MPKATWPRRHVGPAGRILRDLSLFLLLGAAVAIAPSPVRAQVVDLFSAIDQSSAGDTNQATEAQVEKIKERPSTASVTLVRVNVNAFRNLSTRLVLPNAKVLTFNRDLVRGSQTDFSWSGDLNSLPGDATFVVKDGNITGTIRQEQDLYRIEPLGGGIHALIKVDTTKLPPEEPPSPTNQGGAIQNLRDLNDSAAVAPVTIDVLVPYTAASKAAVGGNIDALIELAVIEANKSYANSNVRITLRLVGTLELSYVELDKPIETNLRDIKVDPAVIAARDSRGADIVAAIINNREACGVADAILATADTAFAVVHYDCATGYYSFAHEIGHLQGARHNPSVDSHDKPFAYGHGYVQPQFLWRTAMAYPCGASCPRLPYWANPEIQYEGEAMGTASMSNDARVLNETASMMAGFRSTVAQAQP